jgi:hypothetical protein
VKFAELLSNGYLVIKKKEKKKKIPFGLDVFLSDFGVLTKLGFFIFAGCSVFG